MNFLVEEVGCLWLNLITFTIGMEFFIDRVSRPEIAA